MAPWPGMLARLAGKLTVAWCVRRWGDPETEPTSATTGQAWTFKNYFIALLSSYLGGELVARMVGANTGQHFYVGGIDMTATKLMWSELIHRWPAAAAALGSGAMGQADDFAVLASQASEGDILDDGAGNRWLLQGGKWVAMMGDDGLGQVTEADYLGQVTEADYLGHVMPAEATLPSEAKLAVFQRRGSPDPYHSAFM
jgi:hypothetical protein